MTFFAPGTQVDPLSAPAVRGLCCPQAKCLENGGITKNGSKMGQKCVFSKSDPGPFGMPKQVLLAHFQPVVTGSAP